MFGRKKDDDAFTETQDAPVLEGGRALHDPSDLADDGVSGGLRTADAGADRLDDGARGADTRVVRGDERAPLTGGSGHVRAGLADDASVVLHEERLVADAQKRVAGQVRLSKRTVTEQRTITVDVTREQLVVEHLDADGRVVRTEVDDEAGQPAKRRLFRRGTHPLHELTLYGEDVEVVKTRRALERVKVYVDTHTEQQTVTDDVRHEVVEVERDGERDGVRRDDDHR